MKLHTIKNETNKELSMRNSEDEAKSEGIKHFLSYYKILL